VDDVAREWEQRLDIPCAVADNVSETEEESLEMRGLALEENP
jgi:hypothetical protein